LKQQNNKLLKKNVKKFLGVVINSKLNFKNHIKTIESKLSRAVGILFKLRPVLPREALKSLFCIISPPLLYGLISLGLDFSQLFT